MATYRLTQTTTTTTIDTATVTKFYSYSKSNWTVARYLDLIWDMIRIWSQCCHNYPTPTYVYIWRVGFAGIWNRNQRKQNLKLKSTPPPPSNCLIYASISTSSSASAYSIVHGINSSSLHALKCFCCWELFRLFPASGFRFNPGTSLPLPLLSTPPAILLCVPFSRCAAVDSANVCANIAVFFQFSFLFLQTEGKPPMLSLDWVQSVINECRTRGRGVGRELTDGGGGGTWSEVDGLSMRLIIQTTLKTI